MKSVNAFAALAFVAVTGSAVVVASGPAFVSNCSHRGSRRDAPSVIFKNSVNRKLNDECINRYDSANKCAKYGVKVSHSTTCLMAWEDSLLGELTSKAASIIRNGLLWDLTVTSEEQGQDRMMLDDDGKDNRLMGSVVRTAARAYTEDGSRPSSRLYTTRKDAFPQIAVDKTGVQGDYNDYRTRAMGGTGDRAICILTSDVMGALRSKSQYEMLKDGDLGENIMVDEVSFDFFEVGKRYRFFRQRDHEEGKGVIIEITEPAVPCANLCKLPFINDEKLEPAQRIERCQEFVGRLGSVPGLRGWYAKVIEGGTIRLGDSVVLVGA
mmetsp:Transcript_16457/g.23218  ORF Transcript_16457/g.23218 Transcript_16457/m.23218 type:complete len:324 (+) Transcript_16457:126-1097(+)